MILAGTMLAVPRGTRLLAILLAALTGSAAAHGRSQTPAADRPNVVVILADDLGWGDISLHGGTTPTPNIDGLFRESTELTNFVVTPLCSPTRAALLTGRHPARVGIAPFVVNPKTPATMRPEEVTLAEAFRTAGYATAGYGKWHLGFVYPTRSEGFDEFIGCMAGGVDYFKHTRPKIPDEIDWWRNNEPLDEEGYATDLIRDRAVRYVRSSGDRPFLLYVPFTAVHNPLQATDEYLRRVPASVTDKNKRIYSAMIHSLDKAVGAILRAIREKGIERNTIVFFASDNGATPTGNNLPFRGGKHTIYEGGIRSTTAIRWPDHIEGQRRIDAFLSAEDFYPTILELTGVARPDGPPLDGKDFSPLLHGTSARDTIREQQCWIWHDCDVIRTKQWKMIRRPHTYELYDLQTDPSETTDVADAHPDLVRQMASRLDAWAASIPVYPSHVPVPLEEPAQATPEGDVLEIRARRDSGNEEVFLPLVLAHPDSVLSPGDRFEYDMLVAEDSEQTGFFLDATQRPNDPNPFWWVAAVDQHGTLLEKPTGFPRARGRWARRVTGLANNAPMRFGFARLAFHGRRRAHYRVYVDNVIIRRATGEVIELYRDGTFNLAPRNVKGYMSITVRNVPLREVLTAPRAGK